MSDTNPDMFVCEVPSSAPVPTPGKAVVVVLFPEKETAASIIVAVSKGTRPTPPIWLSKKSEIDTLISSCCRLKAASRIKIQDLHAKLAALHSKAARGNMKDPRPAHDPRHLAGIAEGSTDAFNS